MGQTEIKRVILSAAFCVVFAVTSVPWAAGLLIAAGAGAAVTVLTRRRIRR